jgi:ligand-binding sensor domain-containing protein
VYVALNDRRQDNNTPYLCMSEDKGETWKLISSNLPESPVNVVIEDPDSSNILYCGTDMGVYLSWNRGRSWMAINGNLPASVSVNDMFIHPRDKKLVIATYGRGVWVLDDLKSLR